MEIEFVFFNAPQAVAAKSNFFDGCMNQRERHILTKKSNYFLSGNVKA